MLTCPKQINLVWIFFRGDCKCTDWTFTMDDGLAKDMNQILVKYYNTNLLICVYSYNHYYYSVTDKNVRIKVVFILYYILKGPQHRSLMERKIKHFDKLKCLLLHARRKCIKYSPLYVYYAYILTNDHLKQWYGRWPSA